MTQPNQPSKLRVALKAGSLLVIGALVGGFGDAFAEDVYDDVVAHITGQDPVSADFVLPVAGMTVDGYPTAYPVVGVVDQAPQDETTIWVATKVDGEQTWHPMRLPCRVDRQSVICDQLYLGAPSDAGRHFQLAMWVADD